MSLNPLSSNYLKKFTFGSGKRERQITPTKSKGKTERKKTENKQISAPKTSNNQPIVDNPNEISAVFQLNCPILTGHFSFTIEGYMFSYIKRQGSIYGRANIIFPEAMIASCNVIHGKINGWAVVCKKNAFYNICQFKGGIFDGYQFAYDIACGLMLQTQYKYGKLKSIKKCTVQSLKSFEKQVNNKAALAMLEQTLNNSFFKNYFPCVESTLGNYYGELVEDIPIGLGVLITDCEIFYGQFDRGLLSGIGAISMQDGNYYVGQMQKGMARGMSMNLKNGIQNYQFNQIQVNQQMFKSRIKINSFNNNFQLKKAFGPIVNFYLTLKQIYLKKIMEKDAELSFVDINVVNEQSDHINEDQISTDRKNSVKDSHTTEKKNHINQNLIQKEQYNIIHHGYQPKPTLQQNFPQQLNLRKKQQLRKRKVSEANMDPKLQRQNTLISKKQKGMHRIKDKITPKSKSTLVTDKQWNEIIEQLDGQQSVGRQDGFLQPTKQTVKDNENGQPSLKSHTSKNTNQRMIKIQPQAVLDQQKQQKQINRIVGKLTLKK